MRSLILISFFACLFLHFRSKSGVVEQLDILSTKQSAIKKSSPEKMRLPTANSMQIAATSSDSAFISPNDDQMITDADIQDYDEDDLSQLPWDDIEEGWKTNLKEYLVSVDPEKAEEMLAAYMEEKKKYVERVDFTEQDTAVEESAAPASTDPLAEQDAKEGELERMHAENLKEIFGDHYSQVQSLHQEYVDSVQYLNRSSVKFSISL